MKDEEKTDYVKRTQKDYNLSFKLQVVNEIESGVLSTHGAVKKVWNPSTIDSSKLVAKTW